MPAPQLWRWVGRDPCHLWLDACVCWLSPAAASAVWPCHGVRFIDQVIRLTMNIFFGSMEGLKETFTQVRTQTDRPCSTTGTH